MRNLIRNILIFVLFLISVYQVGMLWFDNFSIVNVQSIFNEKEYSTTKNMDYIINRIIVNMGDNKIMGKTNDLYSSQYKADFDKAVVECVNNGEKVDLGEFKWSNILNNRALIYENSNIFDNKTIKYIFGASISEDKVNDITSFDYVIVTLNVNSGDMTSIFYNSEKNRYSAKRIKNANMVSDLYAMSTDFANDDTSSFISSEQSGFDIFSKNVFIPGWQENSIEYPAVDCFGMYKDESMAEKNAEDYFDNPVTKWSANENDMLTYSDENTVVKYDKHTNVFEYSNYRAVNTSDKTFSANYISAINTLKQDSVLKNEYYLDSYDFNDGTYVFRFNYKINDRFILPDDDIKNKTGMKSFIEVSANSGKTVKYKKYAFYFGKSENTRVAERDFVSAIDNVYTDKKIDDIDLCYVASAKDISLKWIIEIEGKEFVQNAERE